MSGIDLHIGRRSAAVAVAGIAMTLAFGGSAYAYFTTGGSGSGSATVGVGNTIKSTAVTPASGFLFPSTTANGSLALTFTSPLNATVTGIAKDADRTITSSVAGCENFIELSSIIGLSIAVVAPGPTATTTLPNRVRMLIDAPANCQGATFTIPVVLTAQETP